MSQQFNLWSTFGYLNFGKKVVGLLICIRTNYLFGKVNLYSVKEYCLTVDFEKIKIGKINWAKWKHNGGFSTYWLSIHINLVTGLFISIESPFFSLFISRWDKNNCCSKMSKLIFFNQNGQVWKKMVFLSENSCHFVNLFSFQLKWKVQWQDWCQRTPAHHCGN